MEAHDARTETIFSSGTRQDADHTDCCMCADPYSGITATVGHSLAEPKCCDICVGVMVRSVTLSWRTSDSASQLFAIVFNVL